MIQSAPDLEKLLSALHHGRIAPRRLLQLLSFASRLLEISPPIQCSSSSHSSGGSGSIVDSFQDEMCMPLLMRKLFSSVNIPSIVEHAARVRERMNLHSAQEDDITNVLAAGYIESSHPALMLHKAGQRSCEANIEAHLQEIRKTLRKPSLEWRTLRTGLWELNVVTFECYF